MKLVRRPLGLALLSALVAAAPAAAPEPSRTGSIRAEATVEKVLVDAYVVGPHGGALLGLGPQDFLLKVGGVEVPVGDVEFVPASRSELPSKAAGEAREPGTPEFRKALRDAIESTKNLTATHGVFNMSPQDHLGFDQRARVMVKIEGGGWKLVQ